MSNYQLITIIDNKNNSHYNKLVDLARYRGYTECYISIQKFSAVVEAKEDVNLAAHHIVVFLESVENTYSNDSQSNTIVQSYLIDSFVTSTIKLDPTGLDEFYIHNEQKNHDNFIKIPINALNNLKLSFQRSTVFTDQIGPINYFPIGDFPFMLQLKVKFE